VDFSRYVDSIVSFAQNHMVIAIVLALFLLFFIYRRPKLFFGLLVFGLFLAGLFYMITNMARSGSAQKQKLIHGEERRSP